MKNNRNILRLNYLYPYFLNRFLKLNSLKIRFFQLENAFQNLLPHNHPYSHSKLKISKKNYLIWFLLLTHFKEEKKFEEMLYCYENLKNLNKYSLVKALDPVVEQLKAKGIKPRALF